jgi:NAD(P) transhydrogenase subunit alpha
MADGFAVAFIFVLAAIAGNVIISRVPVILHTPLMSGSNFIHGIVLIGAMVVLGHADTPLEKVDRLPRRAAGRGQCRRRLCGDRAHARDVQVRRKKGPAREQGMTLLTGLPRLSYFVAARCSCLASSAWPRR